MSAPTVSSIISDVSEMSGYMPAQIVSRSRFAELVRVRDIACYLAYCAGFSGSHIARVLRRDHSTIFAAVRRECARRKEPFSGSRTHIAKEAQ